MTQGDAVNRCELPKVEALVQRGDMTATDIMKLIEVPADMRCLHAGPLEVKEWRESEPWEMTQWAKDL
jgi:hypothetical protein